MSGLPDFTGLPIRSRPRTFVLVRGSRQDAWCWDGVRGAPATFLAFTQDKTMPPGFWHPGMSGRLNDGAVIEFDGDRELPLTASGLLADALHRAVITPGP